MDTNFTFHLDLLVAVLAALSYKTIRTLINNFLSDSILKTLGLAFKNIRSDMYFWGGIGRVLYFLVSTTFLLTMVLFHFIFAIDILFIVKKHICQIVTTSSMLLGFWFKDHGIGAWLPTCHVFQFRSHWSLIWFFFKWGFTHA